jgi:hypothetical protein
MDYKHPRRGWVSQLGTPIGHLEIRDKAIWEANQAPWNRQMVGHVRKPLLVGDDTQKSQQSIVLQCNIIPKRKGSQRYP